MTDVETLRTDPLEAPANPRILVSTDGELVAAANPASSRLRRFAVTSSRSRGTAETVALALDRLAPPLAARIAEQAVATTRDTSLERSPDSAREESLRIAASNASMRELSRSLGASEDLEEARVGRMIEATLERAQRRRFELMLPGTPARTLPLGGGHTRILGVVNRTPDSFSDGGRNLRLEDAVETGLALVEAGADVLDIGGESTRPGAAPVAADEEIERVVPLIRELARRVEVPISVDTTKAAVAERAIDAGATIVNDVSALESDPRLAEVCARTGVGVALMHRAGTPETMQDDPRYDDVAAEIVGSLRSAVARAVEAGIDEARLIVDPGIGFGKNVEHNLEILRSLDELRSLGLPRLVGTSRKAFLGKLTGAPVDERVAATGATVAWCADRGVELVRVHDVREAKQVVTVIEAIRGGLS